MTMIQECKLDLINVCSNRKNAPRVYLECCKVAVSIESKLCRKRISPKLRVIKCPIARELIKQLREG